MLVLWLLQSPHGHVMKIQAFGSWPVFMIAGELKLFLPISFLPFWPCCIPPPLLYPSDLRQLPPSADKAQPTRLQPFIWQLPHEAFSLSSHLAFSKLHEGLLKPHEKAGHGLRTKALGRQPTATSRRVRLGMPCQQWEEEDSGQVEAVELKTACLHFSPGSSHFWLGWLRLHSSSHLPAAQPASLQAAWA